MKRTQMQGALMATAVAALFLSGPVMAQEEGAEKKEIKCTGANACKGQGACSGAGHECAGKNECKGKGWIKAATEAECKEKGGTVGG
ncbi:MAG: BufA2 family periplasmic bufferin-type metallophore [Candidatus Binatia bacterium]